MYYLEKLLLYCFMLLKYKRKSFHHSLRKFIQLETYSTQDMIFFSYYKIFEVLPYFPWKNYDNNHHFEEGFPFKKKQKL